MTNLKRQNRPARLAIAILALSIVNYPFSIASANPTQEEVFKSISNNLGPTVDGSKVFAVVLVILGAAILMVVTSKRQKKAALPQKLNHQGKLMRELVKTAGLTRGEAKTLQILTQQMEATGKPIRNPLTLMLCPSLTKAARNPAAEE
jgi:hypothetical protein